MKCPIIQDNILGTAHFLPLGYQGLHILVLTRCCQQHICLCQTTRYQNTKHLAFQSNMRLDEIRVHLIFHHYISSGLSRGIFVMFSPAQPRGIRPFPLTKKARVQIPTPFRSLHCTEKEYDLFQVLQSSLEISFFLSKK